MLRMMLRPRWVLALLLALAVAGGFAWLGQWQLSRAMTSGAVIERTTETPVLLTEHIRPDSTTMEIWDGQRVTASGYFDRDDYDVVVDRYNKQVPGFWVVGHFHVIPDASSPQPATDADDGPNLAVALGWAPDRATADAALAALRQAPQQTTPVQITGRYLNTEAPVVPASDADPHEMTTMSVAALINRWHNYDGHVFGGYLVAGEAPPPLVTIDSPPVEPIIEINWLNIFYAAEWAIFAGFAVFFWYRLVKDAIERETELAAHQRLAHETAPSDQS